MSEIASADPRTDSEIIDFFASQRAEVVKKTIGDYAAKRKDAGMGIVQENKVRMQLNGRKCKKPTQSRIYDAETALYAQLSAFPTVKPVSIIVSVASATMLEPLVIARLFPSVRRRYENRRA